VRVWNLHHREILRTIIIPGNDRKARAFTAGMLDDKLYLIDTESGTARPVFDFSTIAAREWPQLMRITKNGKRLFVSMNQAGKVAMFSIEDPEKPRLMKALDLGAGSGPHYVALTKDEKRLVISDYFLNEDNFGKVHAEGDHKVHLARVKKEWLGAGSAIRV
jgi:6-phosphogluconolactonase (cycloisomerase 2 family)